MNDARIIRTWLRFDDVECVRCKRWCGPMGDTVYVAPDGCVCTECITGPECAAAVRNACFTNPHNQETP